MLKTVYTNFRLVVQHMDLSLEPSLFFENLTHLLVEHHWPDPSNGLQAQF